MVLAPPSALTRPAGTRLTAAMYAADVTNAVSFLANPPIFRGVQTVAQSLTSGSLTAISLNTSTYDTYSGHSNVTNNSRYTVQESGYYTVSGVVAFAGNTSGGRQALIVTNGTNVIGGSSTLLAPPTNGDVASIPTATFDLFLNVNDYVELWCAQDSGSTINTATGTNACALWVRYSHE